MKNFTKLTTLAALAMSLTFVACGDESDPDPGAADPKVPTLGAGIDRKGRPAINTAANNTFMDAETRGAAEDGWNANSDPSSWVSQFAATATGGIAVLDSLDGTCGNQVAYDFDPGVGTVNYQALGTVLTNDWLVIKGDAPACTQYLGVEAAVLGVEIDDCGGRKPSYDVIEVSYSALAGVGLGGFDDGITAPAAATADNAFPYLQ